MQQMNVYGVSFDLVGKQPIVLLKTVEGNRFLPIWIGHPEAAAILMKLQNAATPRPMTHDLVTDMCLASGVIQRGLEPRDERVSRGALRLSSARGRHHASAQLAHGLLEHFGALADAVRGHALETDAADLRAIVVTANTVLRDGGELYVGRLRSSG